VHRPIAGGIHSTMRQLLSILICCLALTAQQSNSKGKRTFEFCGPGSSHECSCLLHTLAVQDAYLANCRLNSKSDKELHSCLASLPWHCSIVSQATPVDDEQGEGQSAMTDRCSMLGKKYDCLCDEGARCHLGHSASDHGDDEMQP
jgi:hypothetical protein